MIELVNQAIVSKQKHLQVDCLIFSAIIANPERTCHTTFRLATLQSSSNSPTFPPTNVKFPDFSRFSRWVATLYKLLTNVATAAEMCNTKSYKKGLEQYKYSNTVLEIRWNSITQVQNCSHKINEQMTSHVNMLVCCFCCCSEVRYKAKATVGKTFAYTEREARPMPGHGFHQRNRISSPRLAMNKLPPSLLSVTAVCLHTCILTVVTFATAHAWNYHVNVRQIVPPENCDVAERNFRATLADFRISLIIFHFGEILGANWTSEHP